MSFAARLNNALRVYVPRHHKLLTILSTFIVFGTFIVKDGLRDDFRAYVTAVSNAEGAQLARATTMSVLEHLRTVELRNKDAQKPKDWEENVVAINDYLALAVPSSESAGTDARLYNWTEYLSGLVDLLPDASIREAQKEDIARLRIHVQELSLEGKPRYVHEAMAWGIDSEMRGQEDQIVNQLKTVRDVKKRYADIFQRSSVYLYILGWGLGLLGTIYGSEEKISQSA